MENQGTLFVFIFVFALVYLFVILPVFASLAFHKNVIARRDYEDRHEKIRRVKNHIKGRVESNWPIWPRPILFDSIDKSTQLALARAEQAAQVIREINQSIESVKPVSYPLEIIVNISRNFKILQVWSRNKKRIDQFDLMSQLIVEASQTVNENRKRVKALKKEISERLDELATEYSSAFEKLSFYKKLGAFRFQDINKSLQIVQNCIDTAKFEINNASHLGDVEWACANLICRFGDISLAIYRLKGQSYTYQENYEADEVLIRLEDLATQLDIALDYRDGHDWMQLVELQNRLEVFESELKAIEESLIEFEFQFQNLQNQIYSLMAIDISALYNRAVDAERGLMSYVSPPAKDRHIRINYLRGKELPSLLIEVQNTVLEEKIFPSIRGIVIKQSQMNSILAMIDNFIQQTQRIQKLIKKIEVILHHFIRSEADVKRRVTENGETTILVNRLEKFASNSTIEIMKFCRILETKFEEYKERANGLRDQADFPTLQQDIMALERDVRSLLEQHAYEVTRLQNEAYKQRRKVTGLQNNFYSLKGKTPLVTSYNWLGSFSEFNEIEQEFNETGDDYQLLLDYISHAEVFLEEKERVRRIIEQQHTDFQVLYSDINISVDRAVNEIDRMVGKLRGTWAKPLKDQIILFTNIQQMYRDIDVQLQSTMSDIHLTMNEADKYCRMTLQRVDALDQKKKAELQNAQSILRRLDQIKKIVDSMLRDKKVRDVNPDTVQVARIRVSNALEAGNAAEAEKFLIDAKNILENIRLYAPVNVNYEDHRSANTLLGDVVSGNKVDVRHIKDSNVRVSGRDMYQKDKPEKRRRRR